MNYMENLFFLYPRLTYH